MTLSRIGKFVTALGMMAGAGAAQAAWELNMPRGVTDMTHEVYWLHMMIFWVCVVIGVLVFGVMIYSLIMHRKARGVKPAQFHESTKVEIAWTIVPFLILVAVAIPAASTLLKIEDSSGSDMTIKVTGYQWLWEYDYLDSGVEIFSRLAAPSAKASLLNSPVSPYDVPHYLRAVDNRMVIPVHTKVRLLLTSKDVIHSWWVPKLSGKKDAIPGYINDLWFEANKTGVYRGQCAELCGRGHGYMPIVVEVVSKDDFKAWVASKTAGESAADASEPQLNRVAEESGRVPANTMNPHGSAEETKPPTATAEGDGTSDTQVAQNEAAEPAPAADDAAAPAGGAQMSKAELMEIGEQVYNSTCAACHRKDGSGLQPVFPALAGSVIATGPIDAHIQRVLHGKNAMPPFSSLSNKKIAGVVTYERNSFGNETGD
ncbi:MAG: cytochrome c oxidase subunit II, partial [Salinisphaera sp.]|nr:cytochrome c oxidase subunit II [Salinisphaera sp.]